MDEGIGQDLEADTTEPIPIRRVIDGAKKQQEDFESILILGWQKDGNFYAACSGAKKADVLWILETAKRQLFEKW